MVMIWENIKLACTSLMANKMRALLTMLGIIIGIAAVIAIMTVGDSLVSYVTEELNSMGANNIMVALQPKTDDDSILSSAMASTMTIIDETDMISTDMIDALYEQYKDDILAVTVYDYQGSGQVVSGKDYANVEVYGISLGYFASTDVDIIAGNMFSERDLNEGRPVTIVSSIVVDNLFDGDADKALGSQIEVLVNDKYTDYTIVGVFDYVVQSMQAIMSNEYDISTEMYIPYRTSVSQTHNSSISNFYVVAKNGVDSDILANKIESFFDGYYRNNDDYQVVAYNMQTMVAMVSSMISTITLAISVIAAIALVVGGIGVMNIMLVSITERTREIGTRKALGATNGSIRVQFIVEAMIICLIGGIIGVIVGLIGGQFAAKILGYPASPSISGIIISLIFSMATGLFFGYYPANKAAKMNPIDALRYE
jgi:putative ABC transport system permease protein